MKRTILEFAKRGLMASAGGPIILAIIYGISGVTGTMTALSPTEVCIGIITVTIMAFIAAGITTVYQIEQLPLLSAIMIHCGVLYLDYIIMYLINNWIPKDWVAIGIFTGVFLLGFALVWLIIYLSIRHKTNKLNHSLTDNTDTHP